MKVTEIANIYVIILLPFFILIILIISGDLKIILIFRDRFILGGVFFGGGPNQAYEDNNCNYIIVCN